MGLGGILGEHRPDGPGLASDDEPLVASTTEAVSPADARYDGLGAVRANL